MADLPNTLKENSSKRTNVYVLRSLKKEGYNQEEIDLLFQSLVLPIFLFLKIFTIFTIFALFSLSFLLYFFVNLSMF